MVNLYLVAASIEKSHLAFPLGSLAIYVSLLDDKEIEKETSLVHTHYYIDRDDPEAIARTLAKKNIDIMGLSIYLFNREWMNSFLKAFKTHSPHTTLFAGGPETIAHPDELITLGCSFLILGEGEESTRVALKKWLNKEIIEGDGIYTKESNLATISYPNDLSKLHSVLLHKSVNLKKYSGILWELTRGCPYHCAFCFESKGTRSVRTYQFERIEKELDAIINSKVEHVFVLDPTFNMSKQRTVDLLTFLVQKSPSDIHYTFEIRAELLTTESARLFGELYCSLQIGLQSSNVAVLKGINRLFDPILFKEKIGLLHTFDVVFGLDLIIGLPGDTYESFLESIDYTLSLRPSNIDIFLLSLLPGTELYDRKDQFALDYQTHTPYELIESDSMSKTDIQKALLVKEACDIFYTKGNAVMWFHIMLTPLQLSASRFFILFASFLVEEHISSDDDTYEVQDMFINRIYKEYRLSHLLPIVLSYIEMHQGISYLQETGENPVVALSYEPEALALLDNHSVTWFYDRYKDKGKEKEYYLYASNGQIFFNVLDN
ncbi:MAG: radical SAM protein [Spirochaetia bacterium]|nr:radical SAM protein [Spirochaetia bacterium]